MYEMPSQVDSCNTHNVEALIASSEVLKNVINEQFITATGDKCVV